VALVLDTGPIVAALNTIDPAHAACADLLTQSQEDLVVPVPVLVEVDYWLRKLGGPKVLQSFVSDIADGLYRLQPVIDEDLVRAAELEVVYADLRLGLVDAAVIAICERLREPKVATLDKRHFGVVRPRHVRALELLPR
jgi:uncharacterized protein